MSSKIGLYFGSFNPIHIGHLIIANHIANNTDLKQIWFVVSPQNPLKKTSTLLNEYHRLHLVKVAIQDNPSFRASDVEFKLPKPSFTIDTLTYLKEKYLDTTFSIIMGSDSFLNLERWKNYREILGYEIFVYIRPGFETVSTLPTVNALNAPLLQISSTEIRTLIKRNKSIRYLVPDNVRKEIEDNNYYKNLE